MGTPACCIGSSLTALPLVVYVGHPPPRWLYFMATAFLTFLPFPVPWGLQLSLLFLSFPPPPCLHLLMGNLTLPRTSWTERVTENPVQTSMTPFLFSCWMLTKPAPHRWHCRVWLPASYVVWVPSNLAVCWGSWTWKNPFSEGCFQTDTYNSSILSLSPFNYFSYLQWELLKGGDLPHFHCLSEMCEVSLYLWCSVSELPVLGWKLCCLQF